MDIQQEEVAVNDPVNGMTSIRRSSHAVPSTAEISEAKTAKKNQIIWYVVGIINALLVLRILFLLLGARDVGFASILYAITSPFTALFAGIFAAPPLCGAYFDTAALLAIVIYSLLAWGISALIDLANRPAPVKE